MSAEAVAVDELFQPFMTLLSHLLCLGKKTKRKTKLSWFLLHLVV
jgi:hypothetical protein